MALVLFAEGSLPFFDVPDRRHRLEEGVWMDGALLYMKKTGWVDQAKHLPWQPSQLIAADIEFLEIGEA